MKLFFDTEFTGLRKSTTLISIGIVSEDGRKFYAEFVDFNISQCDKWIKENVLQNLYLPKLSGKNTHGNVKEVVGNKSWVSACLNDWLLQFDTIQFVSDVCHYDFVLLIDLITNGGTALDLPDNISAVCHDINQDIAQHFSVSDLEAFDMSREQILSDCCASEDIATGKKHNSLYDAEVIKAICMEISNL